MKKSVESTKHKAAVEKVIAREKSDSSIVDVLQAYEDRNRPKGETLSDSTKVFRVKVVSTLLRAGIALNKVDDLQELLEEGGYCLSNSTNMRQLVPFILSDELKKMKQEISGRSVSIIFEGTTHVAEAFVLVVRFIGDDWELKQGCELSPTIKKSNGGRSGKVDSGMYFNRNGNFVSVIAAMHDRASVNEVALRTIKVPYNRVFDIRRMLFTHP